MALPILELRRFNGTESYAIESANCNCYHNEGVTEVLFIATTAKSISSLPDTKELCVNPFIEIGFRTKVSLSEVFTSGARYSGLPEYDEDLDEWMTNLYYFEHQGIDNVTITIEAEDHNSVTATIEGTTVDVSYYDGSKPLTTIFVYAVFQKQADLKKSFG
jgi:hypothetical protein